MSEELTLDCNSNELQEGNAVVAMRTLKVKGTSLTIKKGDVIKNIRLTSNPKEIEVRIGRTTIALLTDYFKKH